MKSFGAMACLLCLTACLPAQFAENRVNQKPAVGVETALATVLKDLQEAKETLKKLPSSPTRDRLELLITRSELQLRQMTSFSSPRPTPMNNEDFNRFSISLRGQSFDKDKLAFLENFISSRYVNCVQATTLLKHFSFDIDRIKGAVLLHGRLTDPENFQRVLEAFTFDTSKKTVLEQLKNVRK